MKKKYFSLWFIFSQILMAQNISYVTPFSQVNFGALAGINFKSTKNIGSSFLIEAYANLYSDLSLKLGLGYSKSFLPTSYSIKTFSTIITDTLKFYQAEEYAVSEKEYYIFPFSVGLKYNFNYDLFTPYVFSDFVYNLINGKVIRSSGFAWTYESYEELPENYRQKHYESFPNNSFGINIGCGTLYKLTQKICFDVRYFFKIENKILNTHNIVVGILI